MFYLVQRYDAQYDDCTRHRFDLWESLSCARFGVEVLAYNCKLSPKIIKVADPVEFV